MRINGILWEWLGDNTIPSPNISLFTNLGITPTRTIYQFSAGPMNLTITYLTPIEVIRLARYRHVSLTPMKPADPVKQSFPFIYVSFQAKSTDGQPHSVQVYSDITAGAQPFRVFWEDGKRIFETYVDLEWCSGNRSETVVWDTTTTDSAVYHAVQLQQPTSLMENNDQAEDVTVYYAMAQVRIHLTQTHSLIKVYFRDQALPPKSGLTVACGSSL